MNPNLSKIYTTPNKNQVKIYRCEQQGEIKPWLWYSTAKHDLKPGHSLSSKGQIWFSMDGYYLEMDGNEKFKTPFLAPNVKGKPL